MFNFLNKFLQRGEAENLYDMIRQSEDRDCGWYKQFDSLHRFLGYYWACPGKMIRSSMPAPKGTKDEKGEPLTEIPINQRVGCAYFVQGIAPGLRGLAEVEARCPSCGTRSNLAQFLRERGIEPEQLPEKTRTQPQATRDRLIDTWEDSVGSYEYEPSAPGGVGFGTGFCGFRGRE